MREMQHAAERAGNSYTFSAGDIRGGAARPAELARAGS